MASDRPHIIAVWAECANGPGWSNRLYWALVQHSSVGEHFGKLEQVAIQPDSQTELMLSLHGISTDITNALRTEAAKVLNDQE